MNTSMKLDALISHLVRMREVVGNSPVTVITQTENDQQPKEVSVRRVYMNQEQICILVK